MGAFEKENAAPTATDDSYAIPDDERVLTVPVLDNDDGPEGATLTASVVREPSVGKLKDDGSFTYKKPKKQFEKHTFNGVTFVYEVSDGQGGTDRARLRINKE